MKTIRISVYSNHIAVLLTKVRRVFSLTLRVLFNVQQHAEKEEEKGKDDDEKEKKRAQLIFMRIMFIK
jgi:hypothetical protein